MMNMNNIEMQKIDEIGEKTPKTLMQKIGKTACAILVASSVASFVTGCETTAEQAAQKYNFEGETTYKVHQDDTLWGYTDDIDGIETVDDRHEVISYIKAMPENADAMENGQIDPGEYVTVPDSVERS